MPAAYSIQCPACGAAFLATQTRLTSITSCPHCAHNAPLQDFVASGVTPLGHALPLPLRRRDPRSRPTPATVMPAMPEVPATAPSQTSGPLPDALTPPRRSVPSGTFAAQAGSTPTFEPPPKPTGYSTTGKTLFALLTLAVVSASAWMVWQQRQVTHSNRSMDIGIDQQRSADSPAALTPSALKTDPAPAQDDITQTALDRRIEDSQLASDVPELMQKVFDTSGHERLALVHKGSEFSDRITAFFARPNPPQPGNLKRLPFSPIDLIEGTPAPLFQATTSANPEGALARFHRTASGQLLLDWPLFEETHEQILARFASTPDAKGAQWFHVSLRRSHGLDLDTEARATYHAFDLQASARQALPVHGIVAKDLPMGRFLDQKTGWQVFYLGRLLLQKKTLPSGKLTLEILDCEGSGLNRQSNQTPSRPEYTVPQSLITGPSR